VSTAKMPICNDYYHKNAVARRSGRVSLKECFSSAGGSQENEEAASRVRAPSHRTTV